jgi:cell division protein FtsN
VSASRQRLAARDFKNTGQRDGFDFARYQQFGIGLGIGLLIALGVYLSDFRVTQPKAEVAPKPRADKTAGSEAPAAGEGDDAAPQYDFYDMLPKYEVVVPEQDREVRRDLPSVRVEQPGVYFVQVGSYRDKAEAERLRLKLSKQGIDATIQRVAVDADVWHRVRIGPFRDLKKLNDTRSELRAADVDAIVIRVGD